MLEEFITKLAFEDELEKVAFAMYYHGHDIDKIRKMYKEGLPSGTYFAKKKWVSEIYSSQYPKGRVMRINIPDKLVSNYLKPDIVDAPLPWMTNNWMATKKIPSKYIVDTYKPSPDKIKKLIKYITAKATKVVR